MTPAIKPAPAALTVPGSCFLGAWIRMHPQAAVDLAQVAAWEGMHHELLISTAWLGVGQTYVNRSPEERLHEFFGAPISEWTVDQRLRFNTLIEEPPKP